MNRQKLFLAVCIFSAAASFSGWRHHQAAMLNEKAAAAQLETERIERKVQERTAEARTLEEAVLRARTEAQRANAGLVKAIRTIEKKFPDGRWATQPENLPQWNPDSPYIWIRKDIMKRLPGPAFTAAGELDGRLEPIVTLEPAQLRQLNAELRQCLEAFRAAEASNVKTTDDHLSGVGGQDGEKVTIEVTLSREAGARAKSEFEDIVRRYLGAQRADIVLTVSANWIDSEFAQSNEQAKTITLVRKRNGGYDIAIRSGGSWLSTGFPKERRDSLKYYVPPHLIPFFSELLKD